MRPLGSDPSHAGFDRILVHIQTGTAKKTFSMVRLPFSLRRRTSKGKTICSCVLSPKRGDNLGFEATSRPDCMGGLCCSKVYRPSSCTGRDNYKSISNPFSCFAGVAKRHEPLMLEVKGSEAPGRHREVGSEGSVEQRYGLMDKNRLWQGKTGDPTPMPDCTRYSFITFAVAL